MSHKGVIVLTGASSSLGQGILQSVEMLDSWMVIALSRSKIDSKGKNCKIISGIDLTLSDWVPEILKVLNLYPDIPMHIINCTGKFTGFSKVTEISSEDMVSSWEGNFLTVHNIAKQLMPEMIKRKGGQFIAFTSHSRYQAYPMMAAFECAKAALNQLIKHIANEYLEYGICANSIALATLDTESERILKPKGDIENWLKTSDVARFLIDILNNDSRLMNGSEIELFKYSESYFKQSFYDRIETKEEI